MVKIVLWKRSVKVGIQSGYFSPPSEKRRDKCSVALVLRDFHAWRRKGQEDYLEMYLNTSEMGIGVFGVEAASEYYFNKPAKDLTKNEAARIAAALPLPRKYNVNPPSSFISRRASHIERQMRNIQGSTDLEKVLGE